MNVCHSRTKQKKQQHSIQHFHSTRKVHFIFPNQHHTAKAVDNAFVLRSKPMVTKGQRLQHPCA